MAELTREARQILAEMELLSYGKVASWNSSGGKGENENPVPQGDSNPLHEIYERLFLATPSRDALERQVEIARIELEQIRRRDPSTPVPEEGRDAWEERLIDEGEGHEAKVVATSFGTSVAVVTKLRKKYQRDPNLGLHLSHEDLPPEGKKKRAVELHANGVSTRQIAQLVGVHQTQVVRWSKAQL
jgi:DNA invertase Pin-like site-specific DNA recombinase